VPSRPDPDLILDEILNVSVRLGSGRFLSIDGPAGSGKTTLAGAVADAADRRALSAAVVHMDDLYEGWAGLDLHPEPRVLAQILEPLSRGEAARWHRYDWYAGRFGDWVDQPTVDVLILEGCGSGALAYDAYRALLVWVEVDSSTSLARGIARDGEQVREHWLEWMASESRHFALNDTRARADLLVAIE
jgi:energy-coupling factor transporter ATP-binding protein EcfA2